LPWGEGEKRPSPEPPTQLQFPIKPPPLDVFSVFIKAPPLGIAIGDWLVDTSLAVFAQGIEPLSQIALSYLRYDSHKKEEPPLEAALDDELVSACVDKFVALMTSGNHTWQEAVERVFQMGKSRHVSYHHMHSMDPTTHLLLKVHTKGALQRLESPVEGTSTAN